MFDTIMNRLRRMIGFALPAPLNTVTCNIDDNKLILESVDEQISILDEELLKKAREQWQIGDWQNLISIELTSLENDPSRATLALLVAAGYGQIGDIAAAKKFVNLAKDWGCSSPLISQILISGVYNSLARAAASSGNEKSTKYFIASISAGTQVSDINFSKKRITHQIHQLENQLEPFLHRPLILSLNPQAKFKYLASDRKRKLYNNMKVYGSIKQLANISLGEGWAGNTINTVIFRHHGILTGAGYQYTAFYVNEKTLRILKRRLADNAIEHHDIHGNYNLKDAHNSISMGYDRQGYIHLTYDHHSTSLNYIRALKPHSIDDWSEEIPMTGMHEEQVTYPTFILPRNNYPLTLLYRDGVWNKGSARLKTYDELTKAWMDYPTPILSGADEQPWTCNAYWNHPGLGNDGSLHLSFVWRTHSLGKDQLINNINISYACSHDNGATWQTCRGHLYRLPITPVNAEVIHPVSPGTNLINQCGMAIDSKNRPHIVFYANDESGIPQYQHLRFDGVRWCHQNLSKRVKTFNMMGGGTLKIPISRPDIVIDNDDNAYVIFRGDFSENRLAILKLKSPDYTCEFESFNYIDQECVGYAEPVIDRVRWSTDNILSLFVQYNNQPDHDIEHDSEKHLVKIIDLDVKTERFV
jgi:hypothetical protein